MKTSSKRNRTLISVKRFSLVTILVALLLRYQVSELHSFFDHAV